MVYGWDGSKLVVEEWRMSGGLRSELPAHASVFVLYGIKYFVMECSALAVRRFFLDCAHAPVTVLCHTAASHHGPPFPLPLLILSDINGTHLRGTTTLAY